MLIINRQSTWADRFRAYQIMLNGEQIGKIKNGETVELEVHKGHHEILLKVDWCFSNTLHFDYGDDPVTLECGSNYSGKRLWLGVIHVLFPRQEEDYLWLREKLTPNSQTGTTDYQGNDNDRSE